MGRKIGFQVGNNQNPSKCQGIDNLGSLSILVLDLGGEWSKMVRFGWFYGQERSGSVEIGVGLKIFMFLVEVRVAGRVGPKSAPHIEVRVGRL